MTYQIFLAALSIYFVCQIIELGNCFETSTYLNIEYELIVLLLHTYLRWIASFSSNSYVNESKSRIKKKPHCVYAYTQGESNQEIGNCCCCFDLLWASANTLLWNKTKFRIDVSMHFILSHGKESRNFCGITKKSHFRIHSIKNTHLLIGLQICILTWCFPLSGLVKACIS